MTDQPPRAGSSEEQQSQTGSSAAAPEVNGHLPTFVPPTDIYETKDAIIMLLEMPGVEPNTLDVTLEKHILTVSAQSNVTMPRGYTLIYGEYRDGNYERAFTLSDQIDSDNIDAKFKDGVLRLALPKMNPPPKKIQVKAA